VTDPATLLERDVEIGLVDEVVTAAQGGSGRILLIEGEAGIGKSTLLRHAIAAASRRGIPTLSARGNDLERHYPFGVVLDLLGRTVQRATRRDALFTGAAALAEPIFTGGTGASTGASTGAGAVADPFATLHGLFWLTLAVSNGDPLVMVVDDAHWVDDASLRYLAYLGQRIEDLPIALLLAQRPGEGAATVEPGAALRRLPGVVRLEPQRLSPAATEALMERAGAGVDRPMAQKVWASTRGNPFLTVELTRALTESDDRALSDSDPSAIPERVTLAIRSRLHQLGDAPRRLAEAIAVLGENVTLRQAATLANLDDALAGDAARRLVDASILDAFGSLAFIHPLVRDAVYTSIPSAVRAADHRRAADVLQAAGVAPESVAVQLLAAERRADARVVDVLEQAAAAATASGAPALSQTYLRRAIEEPPSADRRPRILLNLARANAALGTDLAVARYQEALAEIDDPHQRAEVLLELGHTLINAVQWETATDIFEKGLEELSAIGEHDSDLASRLEAGFVSAAFVSLTRRGKAEELLARMLSQSRIDPAHRELAVWAAFQRTAAVTSTADEMRELVDRTLGGAAPEELVRQGQIVEVACGVLLSTDALDHELDLLNRSLEAVQRLGSEAKFGVYSYCRAWPHYYTGHLAEAIADAQAAIRAAELGWETFYPATCSVLGWALIERGELDQAEQAVTLDAERWSERLDYQLLVPITRGRVALERGRLDEAVAQFRQAQRGGERTGLKTPVPPDWRSWLAIALAGLGRRDEAIAVAEEGLELAERWGARWPRGVALRAAGIAHGDERGLDLLHQAEEQLSTGPARLEYARTMLERGAALRRSGRTREARGALSEAADLLHRMGATGLLRRAADELAAAGARPRRYAVRGVEALTPSELRVARLAAAGRTNREVAQSLFVTPKAVEYHLANAYRKLGIGGRAQLGGALGDAGGGASV
jgi:DNA-binding CsgD family transcriptional regulator/ribosomal protein L12E/L44/L45/RPP1/RPP2